MQNVLILVALLVILGVGAGVGWYRGWFTSASLKGKRIRAATMAVNKEKFAEDSANWRNEK